MNRSHSANLPASILQRLLNVSKGLGEDFTLTLARYAIERFLYRLSRSPYADRFVLKGAMLLNAWARKPLRRTRDLDLLGYGEPSARRLRELFTALCSLQVEPDGLEFDAARMRIEAIREDQEYQGERVRIACTLGSARIVVQVDVGFGDAVTPPPEEIEYPTLLGQPAPRLWAYPREAVIAEKFQVIVVLGMRNSRMKDFFEVALIARTFAITGDRLTQAIRTTFARRNTPLPVEVPLALTEPFVQDPVKRAQWAAFLRKGSLGFEPGQFAEVVSVVRDILLPPVQALTHKEAFEDIWPPGGPWRKRERQEGAP